MRHWGIGDEQRHAVSLALISMSSGIATVTPIFFVLLYRSVSLSLCLFAQASLMPYEVYDVF